MARSILPSPSKSYLKYLVHAKSDLLDRIFACAVKVTSCPTLTVVALVLKVTTGISKLPSPGGKKTIGPWPRIFSLDISPQSLSTTLTPKAYSIGEYGLGTTKVVCGTEAVVCLISIILSGSFLG